MRRIFSDVLLVLYVIGIVFCLVGGLLLFTRIQAWDNFGQQIVPIPVYAAILCILPILLSLRLWTHFRARRAASLKEESIMESDNV
ncbi:MAG: hypothetical protein KF842_00935 [Caulobacter sp.]|nr:hypothetical protein [Caulobacter sp.]